MKSIKLVGLLAILITFVSYGQIIENNTQKVFQSGWESLSENNYSIKYPEHWDLNKSGQLGTSFFLFSPLSSEKDQFKENVNLLIQDLAGYNITLEKYVEISENQIKTMITDGQLIESERIVNRSLSYQKMIYTGKQGVFNLKFIQHYWVENNKAYVLTFTCEESQFNTFKSTGEQILNSFQLKLN